MLWLCWQECLHRLRVHEAVWNQLLFSVRTHRFLFFFLTSKWLPNTGADWQGNCWKCFQVFKKPLGKSPGERCKAVGKQEELGMSSASFQSIFHDLTLQVNFILLQDLEFRWIPRSGCERECCCWSTANLCSVILHSKYLDFEASIRISPSLPGTFCYDITGLF